jgi:hypothetical protein
MLSVVSKRSWISSMTETRSRARSLSTTFARLEAGALRLKGGNVARTGLTGRMPCPPILAHGRTSHDGCWRGRRRPTSRTHDGPPLPTRGGRRAAGEGGHGGSQPSPAAGRRPSTETALT